MGSRVIKNLRGIGLSADRLTLDNLTAQGVTATESSFTQTGPRPGLATTADPRAKLDPQISGAQSVAVELEVVRAGLPSKGDLGMIWRLESDSTDDAWRGRAPPNFLNHWVGVQWGDIGTDEWELFDLVTVQSSQDLLCVYAQTGFGVLASTEFGQCRTFDFDAKAWGAAVDVTDSERTWDAVSACSLPNGRALSYWANGVDVYGYYSDDGGATWDGYAIPALIVPRQPRRMRSVYYRGDVAIFTEESTDFWQSGSNSLGTSFVLVSSATSFGAALSIVAIPGNGGIALAYSRNADQLPCVRILAGAFDPFANATEIVIDAAVTVEDCAISCDDNGTLWFIGRDTTGAADDNVWTWFSLDGGSTWARVKPAASDDYGLFVSHDASTYITNYAVAFVRGWMVLVHNWSTTPSIQGMSIGSMWSAGWGSISTSGEGISGTLPGMYDLRFSMAAASGSSDLGSIGVPIELPENTIWTSIGVAPTLQTPGEIDFTVSATVGYETINLAAGTDLSFFFEGKITDGTGTSAFLEYGFEMIVANGAKEYQLEARFDVTNSRVRLYDVHGAATLADISADVGEFIQIVAGIDSSTGQVTVGWRRPFDTHWKSALPAIDFLTNGGAISANNIISFGIKGSTTGSMRVRQWHHAEAAFSRAGDPVGLEFGKVSGSEISSGGNVTALPVAIPEIGTATQSAFISAGRGPGRFGDAFSVEPFYDFGIDRIFPSVSPSPADPWRSADLTEQLIVWDFGQATRFGEVWLMVAALINTNIKTAHIEAGTGSIWLTKATYNAATGFEALGFERNGDTIRPSISTLDGARFLNRNELAGGFVIMTLGGNVKQRKIVRNSAGGWTGTGVNTTLLPEIRLEGIDGTEPVSGSVDIVWPSGVVFHTISPELPGAAEYFRYWRLRIPVQDVVDPYYQVGNFLMGSATVFGKQNSRGWSQAMEPNTSRRSSRFGTVRKKKNGPPARRWSMGWTDGVFLGALRSSGVDQDYLAPSAGDAAVAALNDVWGLMWGLLEETEGGQEAILALNTIPAGDDVTVTDRLRWLYGTWDSGVQANQVVGNENQNEFVRIDPISVAELK